ncbi:FAD-dependent monooxygenase [Sphingosinicella xenopeptidilytica]|uniref:FAD-dependent monooxygenase n=1 Tax=Sphingosinicella xenopeptidilytica TaxID=364098 RepID=A0ABW3C0R8_SPHXN
MIVEIPVMIAGGGPVGMTLALELARHGVRSILVERNTHTTRHPKMDLTNGRSMELYRRLGLSDRLRAVGVPEENPWPIIWCTAPNGEELARFDYPCAAEQRNATALLNNGSGTAEPGMRISQIVLEPVLKKAIEENPLVDARFGWMFETLQQEADGVVTTIKQTDGEQRASIRSDYLIGCDGGGSRVRRAVGIELEGNHDVARIMMIHFRSDAREILARFGIAWHLQNHAGSLVAQDDRDTWTAHLPLLPGTDETTLDAEAMIREFVGQDFPFEILMANPWTPRLVIAERYIADRVILAGDAAHQVIPTGGYGMNTGVGDAVDLGWKLAATIKGWGGDALLKSYESERMAVAVQNRQASERHFAVRMAILDLYVNAMTEGELDAAGPEGAARRSALSESIKTLGNAENESWGIEHGYRYPASAILAVDAGPPPTFDPLRCIPTTYPGARLPHILLSDSTPLLDKLGPAFSVIAVRGGNARPFVEAADELGIPLTVAELPDQAALHVIDRRLLLVRPDGHIAWRGDDVGDARSVLTRASGRISQNQTSTAEAA